VVVCRGGARLSVNGTHGGLLHRLEIAVLEVRHARDGEIEIVGPRPLHPGSVSVCWG
jgi:hypothetical protein